AIMARLQGQFDRTLALNREGHRMSIATANRQIESWSLMGQADALLRLGRAHEAATLYESSVEKIDERAMRSEAVLAYGMLALARLRIGDQPAASQCADRTLAPLLATTPVVYYTQTPPAATAEVFLSLLEVEADEGRGKALTRSARRACLCLRRFARRFP